MEITTKRRLKKDVFRLISGVENEEKALNECLAILGIAYKQTLTRRSRYSPAEKLAVEKVFKKYGVTKNIWTHANQTRK